MKISGVKPITAKEQRMFAKHVKRMGKILMSVPAQYELKRGREVKSKRSLQGYRIYLPYPAENKLIQDRFHAAEAAHIVADKILRGALPKWRIHKGKKERVIRSFGGVEELFDGLSQYRLLLIKRKWREISELEKTFKEANSIITKSIVYDPSVTSQYPLEIKGAFGGALAHAAVKSGFNTPKKIDKLMLILSRKDFLHMRRSDNRAVYDVTLLKAIEACKRDKRWKTMKYKFARNIAARSAEFIAMAYIKRLGKKLQSDPNYLDKLVKRAKGLGVITVVK